MKTQNLLIFNFQERFNRKVQIHRQKITSSVLYEHRMERSGEKLFICGHMLKITRGVEAGKILRLLINEKKSCDIQQYSGKEYKYGFRVMSSYDMDAVAVSWEIKIQQHQALSPSKLNATSTYVSVDLKVTQERQDRIQKL